MILPMFLVALAITATFWMFRLMDHWINNPPAKPTEQPNEDDPEFMAWLERKLRHLEE